MTPPANPSPPACGDRALPALVLTFTEGVSLRTWAETGMLGREWALYRELLPYYSRIVLVTYGHEGERELLTPFVLPGDAAKVSVVANEARLAAREYAAGVPRRVAALVPAGVPVVVKTNQMQGGEVAIDIARCLRGRGHPVGLVARGGFPWSLFVENDKGATAPEAAAVLDRERALVAAADVVVGTSREMLEHLTTRHAIEPGRTRLIPNYVDLTRDPTPVQRREPGALLYAGQLVQRKRVDVLIEAMALLPDALRTRTHLEIVGDGPERARLQKLAAALAVPARFASRVPHHDLLDRMHRCAVYVQASALEGHPKTVIEAMTTGAPVVVAEAPGLEVVTDGVDGRKVSGSPRAFATALVELLEQPHRRARLGTAAAHSARRRFGLPAIVSLELAAHRDALPQAVPA